MNYSVSNPYPISDVPISNQSLSGNAINPGTVNKYPSGPMNYSVSNPDPMPEPPISNQRISGYAINTGPVNTSTGGTGTFDLSNIQNPYSTSSSNQSSSSTSHSGLRNELLPGLKNLIGDISGMLPQYQQAISGLQSLPGLADKWAQEQVKQYRLTGEDISNTLNAIGNQRASAGILGGTETDAMRSGFMAQLAQQVAAKRAEAMNQANQVKSAAYMALPSATSIMPQLLPSLFSQGQQSDGSSYGSGSSYSYQTDPTAAYQIAASLLQSNF